MNVRSVEPKDLRLAIFGLGYVGAVSAACFSARGFPVIGVDVDEAKVAAVNNGVSPVLEDAVSELIAGGVDSGRLRATTDARAAVQSADAILVCVGTPSASGGGASLIYLERVIDQIGEALADSRSDRVRRPTVIVRSTVMAGTSEDVVVPRLEKAGLVMGRDVGLAFNPEFLREGTSVADFFDPPKTVIGQFDDDSGDLVASIYKGLPGPVYRLPLRVAEIGKYIDNAFHALKIGFANEVGAYCAALGIDSHDVMDVFLADRKLNISPAYLRPGFAFGGSCLPKDLRAVLHTARHVDLKLPILEAILDSNARQISRAYDMIAESGLRKVSMFGLAFKAGTDDLRESPLVELAERLLGRGFDLRIWDPHVTVSRLSGANREHVEARIPHLSRLLTTSLPEAVEHGDVVVLGTSSQEAANAAAVRDDSYVVDLVHAPVCALLRGSGRYRGISW
jgi:GDP-mannose 6-dehydrogenase